MTSPHSEERPDLSEDIMAELEASPSAWLPEVTFAALTAHESFTPGWTSWVHGVWPAESTPPEDFEVIPGYSTVREAPFLLGRTPSPSTAPLSSLAPPSGAEAFVVLSPQYLVALPLPYPLVVPATSLFPHDPPGGLTPPPLGRQPLLTATGCTADGNVAFMARLLSPDLTISQSGIDLCEKGGVISLQPSLLPIPWLRLAMTGSSGVTPQNVPVSPHMPILSLWLSRLLLAAQADDTTWGEALSLLDEWASLTTWDDVLSDQRGPHSLGVLAPLDTLPRLDSLMLGILVLSETPAPPAHFTPLMAALSPSRRRSVKHALARHPDHAHWLEPDRPTTPPIPWR